MHIKASSKDDCIDTCRSQTIAQAVRSSLSEVTPSSQEQPSVPVEAFIRELHAAVDSLQDSRSRASEAVTRLEQLPGAVLSGGVDHAVVEAEARWLMTVASSSTLPGAPLFTPVFPVLRTMGCGSTTHERSIWRPAGTSPQAQGRGIGLQ